MGLLLLFCMVLTWRFHHQMSEISYFVYQFSTNLSHPASDSLLRALYVNMHHWRKIYCYCFHLKANSTLDHFYVFNTTESNSCNFTVFTCFPTLLETSLLSLLDFKCFLLTLFLTNKFAIKVE